MLYFFLPSTVILYVNDTLMHSCIGNFRVCCKFLPCTINLYVKATLQVHRNIEISFVHNMQVAGCLHEMPLCKLQNCWGSSHQPVMCNLRASQTFPSWHDCMMRCIISLSQILQSWFSSESPHVQQPESPLEDFTFSLSLYLSSDGSACLSQMSSMYSCLNTVFQRFS